MNEKNSGETTTNKYELTGSKFPPIVVDILVHMEINVRNLI